MKRLGMVFLIAVLFVLSACSSEADKLWVENSALIQEKADLEARFDSLSNEYNQLTEERSQLTNEYDQLSQEYDQLKTDNSKLQNDNSQLQNELQTIKNEYAEYKTQMSEYEGLSSEEAEARRIEAERIKAEEEAEKQRQIEEERKVAEQAAREAEEKEKKGYDTGITYSQLARTPDDYKGEKVKFYGQVAQVLEGDGTVDIRLAINGNYDQIVYLYYESSIVKSRVLEDDYITIYGVSQGLYTYQSTMGGQITIPLIFVDKIDQY